MCRPEEFEAAAQIQAVRLPATTNSHEPILIWVHSGHARIIVEGLVHELTTGDAVWVPGGVPHIIDRNADSIVFPIFFDEMTRIDAPRSVTRLTIPRAWNLWLIHRFALMLGYLPDSPDDTYALIDLFRNSAMADAPGDALRNQTALRPPLPRSRSALRVARSIVRTPKQHKTLADYAAEVHVSERTLRRQFTEETGLSFVRWRLHSRIATAATYLAAGHSVTWTSRQVGFKTPAGFARAFSARTGLAPRDYVRGARGEASHGQTSSVLAFDANKSTISFTPPPIPAVSTWERVNGFHVIVWVYRGAATAVVGEQSFALGLGDAILLPAGVRNCIHVERDSLALPLAFQHPSLPLQLNGARVMRYPRRAEQWLLGTLVANHTRLHSTAHDADTLFRFFAEPHDHPSPPVTDTYAAVVAEVIATVRMTPAIPASLDHWARTRGLDTATLRARFAELTGHSFPRWRGVYRMSRARELLELGMPIGEVARKLGYAHTSSFTRVFTDAHGSSPSNYQHHYGTPLRMRRD